MLLLLLLQGLGPPPGEGSSYAARLNWALTASGVSQSDLARQINVAPQAIQYLADPKKHARGSKHTTAIAEVLGVFALWLATGKGKAHDKDDRGTSPSLAIDGESGNVTPADVGARRIPLVNYVQAGAMTEMGDNDFSMVYDDYLVTDRDDLSPRTFALEIKGRSMEAPPGTGGPSFHEGDRIIVDRDVSPLPGDFVVAKNGPDGEHGEHAATFKKYRPRGVDEQGRDVFELVPLNPDFATLRSDRQEIKIIGTVVEHRRYWKKR